MKHVKLYEDFLNESEVNEAVKLDLQNDIFDSGKGGYKDWSFDPAKKKLTVTYDRGKWDNPARCDKEITWLATNDRKSIGADNQLVGYLDLYLEPHGLEVDKKRAHKYDLAKGKVELNLTDSTGGNSYGRSVWENALDEGIMTTPSWREANPSVNKLVNDIKKIILRQVSPANIHAMFTIVNGQPTLLINDKNSKLSSYLDLTELHNLLDKNNMSEGELRIVFKN